ncbi:MAG: UDP-glucose 4-epimerase, partial [Magnetococcales bacterium]|nr:UDP-glucose 4-epimerase [Magnetococcales bacterium]
IRDYCHAHEMRAVALRYFNAAGADHKGRFGERHDPETHLIPLVLETAMGKRDLFTILGGDYPTPDGTCIRDFIHVTDIADAHLKALTLLPESPGHDAFNLGNKEGISVREIITTIERITGRPVPVRVAPRRPGDPPALVGDPTRAENSLGWKPRHSDLETIITTAWSWMRQLSEKNLPDSTTPI